MHNVTVDVEVTYSYSETRTISNKEYEELLMGGAPKFIDELYDSAVIGLKGSSNYDFAVFDEDKKRQIVDWIS